jgi:hypothetical protein
VETGVIVPGAPTIIRHEEMVHCCSAVASLRPTYMDAEKTERKVEEEKR